MYVLKLGFPTGTKKSINMDVYYWDTIMNAKVMHFRTSWGFIMPHKGRKWQQNHIFYVTTAFFVKKMCVLTLEFPTMAIDMDVCYWLQ